LIELLVVVAIISVLAALLLPALAQARSRAKKIACLSNLKQIGASCLMYAQDYHDRFPSGYYSYPFGDLVPSDLGLYRGLVYKNYTTDAVLGCPVGRMLTPYPGGWSAHGYRTRAEAIDAGWTFSYHYLGNWNAQHPDLGEGGVYGFRSPTGLRSDPRWLLAGDLASVDYLPQLNLPHLNHRNFKGTIDGSNWLFVDAHAEWVEYGKLNYSLVRDGCVYFLPAPGVQD